MHESQSSYPQKILVTGPARSGKSEWAEQIAAASPRNVIYIATAQQDATDREWQARIEQHQQRRPTAWSTQEVPIALDRAIAMATTEHCLLIDSLGTWLANVLEQDKAQWQLTQQQLLEALRQTESQVILVAEETGWGVVPAYPLGRHFRDRLGHLVRQISAIVDTTYLVTGGYALDLRELGTPISESIDDLEDSVSRGGE